jgi:hypothetical protein
MKSTRSSTSWRATPSLILLAIGAAGCPLVPTSSAPITTQSGTPVPAARIYQPQFTQSSPGNTAKVLFLRDAGSLGSACAHEILVDGDKVLAIRAGEYQALFLAPGQHSFVVEIKGGLCPAFSKEHSTVLRDGAEETYRIFIPSLTSEPNVEIVSSAAPIGPASSAETTGLDKGLAAHRRGDYDTAFRELLPLAEQGVAEAQLGVGVMYSDGQGVAADPSEAVKWLRRAAEQGLADAQLSLANMYFLGQQVPGDPAEAVKWYRRAAEQGHPQAQFSLASMYSVGTGVTQDYVLAYMWCTVSDAGSGVRRCDHVADKMTKEQIVRAKELASKFVPRQERSARPPSGTLP